MAKIIAANRACPRFYQQSLDIVNDASSKLIKRKTKSNFLPQQNVIEIAYKLPIFLFTTAAVSSLSA